ncbi:unnamed protein product [Orchesella dallaii]|uniref:Uncharacterized protein n=1 Tax=Orchesella dallaii TaxID=48710 RepID=A0ABP1S7S7_9HEXA
MKTNELEKTVGTLGVEIALEKQKTKSLEQQNLRLIQEKAQLQAIVEMRNEVAKEIKTSFEEKIRKLGNIKKKDVIKLNMKRNYGLKTFLEEINAMRDQLNDLINSKYQFQTP